MVNRTKGYILLSCILFVASMIWLSYYNRLFGLHFKSKFIKEVWLKEPNSRITMIDNLIENNLLIGKEKRYVIELLGNDCKVCDTVSNNWMYYIEIKDGHPNLIFKILDIEFFENKVIKVSQRG